MGKYKGIHQVSKNSWRITFPDNLGCYESEEIALEAQRVFIEEGAMAWSKLKLSLPDRRGSSMDSLALSAKKLEKQNALVESNRAMIHGKEILFDPDSRSIITSTKWRFSINGLLFNRRGSDYIFLWREILNDHESHTVKFLNENIHDYRMENLKALTRSESAGMAGFRDGPMVGIRQHKNGKYQVSIPDGKGKSIHIGYFTDLLEAQEKRKQAVIASNALKEANI